MASKKFQVEVVSRQRSLYHVEAPDAKAAERLAIQRWQNGQDSDVTGFEAGELLSVHSSEAPDELRQSQDDELILRFIAERERLLAKLTGDILTASPNDAVSASQVAADLGWLRRGRSGEGNVVDTARAAESLERLCAARRLVCFERDRVRAGERGSIRLYCSPDYLERLSAGVHESPRNTATA